MFSRTITGCSTKAKHVGISARAAQNENFEGYIASLNVIAIQRQALSKFLHF